MKPLRLAVALLAAALCWTSAVPAQEAPKDDALDRLLEQAGGQDPTPPSPSGEAQPVPDGPKDDAAPTAAGGPAPGPAREEVAPPAELAPKDQDLDELLEKFGQTEETPAPAERPRGLAPGEPAPPAPKPDGTQPDDLKAQDQKIDERLKELLGRKHRKPEDEEQEGGGSDPISQAVKKMREVEKRLSEPDTGEETRKKQEQIVKDLDEILEQIRSMKGQPGKPGSRIVAEMRQQGRTSKPGNEPGSNPGNNPGGGMMTGVKFPKPQKFFDPKNKDVWGHLQDDMKGELDNVSRERFLPAREDLIRRYYESVARKSRARED